MTPTVPDNPVRCCLCNSPAVAVYYLSRGCAARPDLSVQPLCAQHECDSTPLAGMELLKDLRREPLSTPETAPP